LGGAAVGKRREFTEDASCQRAQKRADEPDREGCQGDATSEKIPSVQFQKGLTDTHVGPCLKGPVVHYPGKGLLAEAGLLRRGSERSRCPLNRNHGAPIFRGIQYPKDRGVSEQSHVDILRAVHQRRGSESLHAFSSGSNTSSLLDRGNSQFRRETVEPLSESWEKV